MIRRRHGRPARALVTPRARRILLALGLAAAVGPGSALATPAETVPGEIVVRYRVDAGASDQARARSRAEAVPARRLALPRAQVLRAGPGEDVGSTLAALRADPAVAWAEPSYVVRAARVPNDPRMSQLWAFRNTGQAGGTADADIDLTEAWDTTVGSDAVTVAVVDTGVDLTHPDLAGAAWVNPGESGSGRETNGLDDDANGYVDDARGWDWLEREPDAGDDGNGHGTHVAGTIAARGDDSVGVAGISWHARVMALRALDDSGTGSTADIASAFAYAAANGARIVNASLGSDGRSRAVLDAIAAAPQTLFVVAAGNSGLDLAGARSYPCEHSLELPNVICVAATDDEDARADFSNYGSAVGIAAPGVGILSTLPGNGYAWYGGTSMAAPHVAGVAALVLGLRPAATTAQLKVAVLTGDAIPGLTPFVPGGLRLNAASALAAIAAAPAPTAPPPSSPAPPPEPQPTPAPPVADDPGDPEVPDPGRPHDEDGWTPDDGVWPPDDDVAPVDGGPSDAPPPPAPPRPTAPTLSAFRASPSAVRAGRPLRLTWTLDRSATIRLVVRRARTGRVAASLGFRSAAGGNAVMLATPRRGLAAGVYRVTAIPSVAGRAGRRATATVRILGRR